MLYMAIIASDSYSFFFFFQVEKNWFDPKSHQLLVGQTNPFYFDKNKGYLLKFLLILLFWFDWIGIRSIFGSFPLIIILIPTPNSTFANDVCYIIWPILSFIGDVRAISYDRND